MTSRLANGTAPATVKADVTTRLSLGAGFSRPDMRPESLPAFSDW